MPPIRSLSTPVSRDIPNIIVSDDTSAAMTGVVAALADGSSTLTTDELMRITSNGATRSAFFAALAALDPAAFYRANGAIGVLTRELVAAMPQAHPTPNAGPNTVATLRALDAPRVNAANAGVRGAMQAAITSLASPRSRMTTGELVEIFSNAVTTEAFCQALYNLQRTNPAAARRVFGTLSTLVEGLTPAQRETTGPTIFSELASRTSFEGAPVQARAFVEALSGYSVSDELWEQLLDSSLVDPYAPGEASPLGSVPAPDPSGFMQMFTTPRLAPAESDPSGLGDVPPPDAGPLLLPLWLLLTHHL